MVHLQFPPQQHWSSTLLLFHIKRKWSVYAGSSSHSILGIWLPKYFKKCLLKFIFAKMSFEGAKNINMRPRFQSILRVEKDKALRDLAPTSSPVSCVLLFYLSAVPSTLAPCTAQAQSRLMALSHLALLVRLHPSVPALMPPQKCLPWCFYLFPTAHAPLPFPILSVFEFGLSLPQGVKPMSFSTC